IITRPTFGSSSHVSHHTNIQCLLRILLGAARCSTAIRIGALHSHALREKVLHIRFEIISHLLPRNGKPANSHDQRARPEMLGVIEASVGRAPLDWMLGATQKNQSFRIGKDTAVLAAFVICCSAKSI